MTVHSQNSHTGSCGFPEGSTEGWICGIIGMQILDISHLDYKEYIGPKTILSSLGKFL